MSSAFQYCLPKLSRATQYGLILNSILLFHKHRAYPNDLFIYLQPDSGEPYTYMHRQESLSLSRLQTNLFQLRTESDLPVAGLLTYDEQGIRCFIR